ncbi:hypothetical protein D9M70_574220 [compost metagenome]
MRQRRVRRRLRDHEAVGRHAITFLLKRGADGEGAARLLRVNPRLVDVVRVAQNYPNVADGKLPDIALVIERRPIRHGCPNYGLGLAKVRGIGRIYRVALVSECGGNDLPRIVKHCDLPPYAG